ncbi:hypothetical protein GCM10011588_72520 [Nocardia jinanensis]|uniref:Uncharacterized protein n=1 Tax=Nocardia jinanensis TaxID=382504 RepID=A0A917W0Q5_9NOCA|nr:hypothetical protein GCM10011588_72520 [Nocardia jinanensis]
MKIFLDGLGLSLGDVEHPVGSVCQMRYMGTTVVWVRAASDEPEFRQLVDESDHGVAVNVQQVGEPLLAPPIGSDEIAEDSEGYRGEPKRVRPAVNLRETWWTIWRAGRRRGRQVADSTCHIGSNPHRDCHIR